MKLSPALRQAAYPVAILGQRNFSLVWGSIAQFQVGSQMEALVLGWFVIQLTDSPFLGGLIAGARMALNFLALFAGAIADRLPRHRLLAGIELVMTGLGLLVLTLMLTGLLEVWHLFAVTIAASLVRIFQMPSAQALIGDTLPPDKISNGAALTSMAQNFSTILGPLLGGFLYKGFGPEGAYAVISLFYFSSSISAMFIRPVRSAEPRPPQGSVLQSVGQRPILVKVVLWLWSVLQSAGQGLRYVKSRQLLWVTLLMAVIINLTGWPFHTALLPIFAEYVLHTDSAGLGWLSAAFGIGALSGSLGWASVRNLRHIGKLMILAIIVWHGSMLLFALSDSLYWSMGILLLTGAAFSSTQTMMLTMLLRNTTAEYRGRVLGLRVLAIFAYSFGGANVGYIAGLWSAPLAAVTIGIAGIALTLALAAAAPRFLRA